MRTVEIAEATASLGEYARKIRKEPLVVMRRGKPVVALMPLSEDDWEDLVVSKHPKFIALMRRSFDRYKPGTGTSLEDLRRECGLESQATRKRKTGELVSGPSRSGW
jgi:hypothetical protein